MPNLDTSDYIRKVKLRAKVNADSAADPRKFRALTQHVTYDPYRVIEKNISFDDGFLENKHYVFKAPCCFVSRAPSTLETIILENNLCNTDFLIRVVEGTTYLITNNSGTTTFTISGSPTVYEIPEGESEFTALTSGNLQCYNLARTLSSNYCSGEPNDVIEGITYSVTNNSGTTQFTISGSPTVYEIPEGESEFTALTSGNLQCSNLARTLSSNYCSGEPNDVIEGITYSITNDSGTTQFIISGSSTVYDIPTGPSNFTAPSSGDLLCLTPIILVEDYCSNAQTSVVQGKAYLITNNSATTSFTIVDNSNYPIVSIPSGTSVFTAPASGTLDCNSL